jgi:CRISPR/Cas system-associated endoribonuclease Cas2
MKGPVLICYDIFDDGRRARVRDALGEVADRFQQSGWLVPDVAGLDADRVSRTLAALLAPPDRVRVYAPCPDCVRAARSAPTKSRPGLLPAPAWIAE